MKYIRFLLFVLAMVPSFGLSKARIHQDSILSRILELYSGDLLGKEDLEEEPEAQWGRNVTDYEGVFYPESVEILPLDQDTICFVAMVTWGPEYTRGLVTDFYEFERMESTLRLISSVGGGEFGYGGGTQRYGNPELSDSLWHLGQGIVGFTVELGSHHMASQTESTEIFLFALMDNEVKKVLSMSVDNGFSSIDLASESPDDRSFIQNVYENIDEYIPKDYSRDCICEDFRRISMGKGSTLGLRDLVIERTEYKLTPKRILKSVNKETWKWDGDAYKCGEKETY